MADMTISDMAALTNKGESFLEGNGIIILILFFLLFGWGGRNDAAQNAITRAEMTDGFNTNEIKNGILALQQGHCELNNSVMTNRYDSAVGMAGLDKSIMQNRYDTLMGQNALAAQIAQNRYDAALAAQTAQAQMATCCCDLRTAVHAEGEATRAMIQQQTIDDLKQQLSLSQTANANAVQTQNILTAMGRYYANPPYGGCGCGGCGCN